MTARRRAGETGQALRRGLAAPEKVQDTRTRRAASPAAAEQPSKYTALLDPTTAAAFDELALAARRALGRKVDKSQLMRALIMLTADDASLRDQMIEQLRHRG